MPATTHDNPLTLPRDVVVTESLRRAAERGLIKDSAAHRLYVAISPHYAPSKSTQRRVLACRIVVCLFSFLIVVFSTIGQAVPYVRWKNNINKFSVWRQYNTIQTIHRASNAAMMVFAVFTTLSALFAMIIAAVHAARWSHDAQAREEAERDNLQLQYVFGNTSASPTKAAAAAAAAPARGTARAAFPFSNARVPNVDHLRKIRLESEETKRRHIDNALGIAILSLLLVCAASSVIVAVLMTVDMPQALQSPSSLKVEAGFPLFLVAVVLSMTSVLCVTASRPAHVNFRDAAVEKCELMVVEEDAFSRASEPDAVMAV